MPHALRAARAACGTVIQVIGAFLFEKQAKSRCFAVKKFLYYNISIDGKVSKYLNDFNNS